MGLRAGGPPGVRFDTPPRGVLFYEPESGSGFVGANTMDINLCI